MPLLLLLQELLSQNHILDFVNYGERKTQSVFPGDRIFRSFEDDEFFNNGKSRISIILYTDDYEVCKNFTQKTLMVFI